MRLTENGLQALGFSTTMRALLSSDEISEAHNIDEQYAFEQNDDYETWLVIFWGVSAIDDPVDFISLWRGVFYAPQFSTTMMAYSSADEIENDFEMDAEEELSDVDFYEDLVKTFYGIEPVEVSVNTTRILHKTVFSQNFEEV